MPANSTLYRNQSSGHNIFCAIRQYGLQQKTFIIALFVIISMTAFIGNVLIIVALKRVYSLHPPSKILFRCLASTDIGAGLLAGPLFVSFLMSQEHTGACKSIKTISYCTAALLGLVSMLTVTAISADRLLALLLRLRYRQEVTSRRVRVTVVFFWLLGSVIATTVIYNSFVINVSIFIIDFLCVAFSTFCYAKIYFNLRQQQMQIQMPEQGPQGKAFNIARYKRTVTMLVWIQITMIACYVPHAIVQAVYTYRKFATPFFDLIWDVTLAMAFFNSAVNPFLYCWKVSEVRQAVKETIRVLFC